MSPADVADSVRAGKVILDVRSAAEFGTAHVPGSLNIGLSGQFASWAGTLISMETPLVLVAGSKEQAEEARTRLARVGLEKVTGFLVGGIDAWKAAGFDVATVQQISVAELKELIASRPDLQVVDVRRAGEFESGHAPQAIPAPLSNLNETLPSLKLNPTKLTAVICAGGYRSSAATSIMQLQGFTNLLNVSGGTSAWVKAGYEVEKSVPLASASGS